MWQCVGKPLFTSTLNIYLTVEHLYMNNSLWWTNCIFKWYNNRLVLIVLTELRHFFFY